MGTEDPFAVLPQAKQSRAVVGLEGVVELSMHGAHGILIERCDFVGSGSFDPHEDSSYGHSEATPTPKFSQVRSIS